MAPVTSRFIQKFLRLKELVGAIAPESVTNLNDGAPKSKLEELRSVVPLAPPALLELLQLHNGEEMIAWVSLFPDGMQLMDADHILQTSRHCQGPHGNYVVDVDHLVAQGVMSRPIGPVKPVFSSSKRVPFAHVNAELLWYFDMDPDEGGALGQIVYEDSEALTLGVVATSFEDLVEKYVRDIEAGLFYASDDGQIASPNDDWYMRGRMGE